MSTLTSRERQVLQLLATGCTRELIGQHCGVSRRTIESYLSRIYGKLGAINGYHAIALGLSYGYICPVQHHYPLLESAQEEQLTAHQGLTIKHP